MSVKTIKNKNVTTSFAGLAIYAKLWDKFGLSQLFDSAVPKHSGSLFSAIMQNLFFRNLIDANSMSALSDADKQEYFLQQNGSLNRTTYGRNLKQLNENDRKTVLLKFNNNFISRDEIDEDAIMIYDTTAIKAEGKKYENTKQIYDACDEKIIQGYALNKLLLRTKKKLSVPDFDLQNEDKDKLIGKFKQGRRQFGVDKIVFDTGPENSGIKFFQKLDEEEFLFYTKAAKHWKFNYGKNYNIKELRKILKKRIKNEGMVSIEVFWYDMLLRLIFVQGDKRVYLTNDLEIPAGKAVRYYQRRWDIEISFREEKQNLGLNKLPCWNEEGIRTHFLLAMLGFILSQLIIAKVDIVNGIKLVKRRIVKTFAFIKDKILCFTENFKFKWVFNINFV